MNIASMNSHIDCIAPIQPSAITKANNKPPSLQQKEINSHSETCANANIVPPHVKPTENAAAFPAHRSAIAMTKAEVSSNIKCLCTMTPSLCLCSCPRLRSSLKPIPLQLHNDLQLEFATNVTSPIHTNLQLSIASPHKSLHEDVWWNLRLVTTQYHLQVMVTLQMKIRWCLGQRNARSKICQFWHLPVPDGCAMPRRPTESMPCPTLAQSKAHRPVPQPFSHSPKVIRQILAEVINLPSIGQFKA